MNETKNTASDPNKKKNPHGGHRARMKNKFASKGLSSFEDHEILELLLFYSIARKDTNEIAHDLIEKFGSLNKIFDADISELCKIKGIGNDSAILIKLVSQSALKYLSEKEGTPDIIQNSHEAGMFVCSRIGCLKNEVFSLICLNSQRGLISFDILEEGTVSQSSVSPRKVVECAIRHNAASVILAHNHPSGTMVASEEDRHVTKKLCNAFESIGINVIDHIIAAGATRYVSMNDSGQMDEYYNY